jgi:hypothetical protein
MVRGDKEKQEAETLVREPIASRHDAGRVCCNKSVYTNPPHTKSKLQGLSKKAVDQVLVFQKNEESAAKAPPREKGNQSCQVQQK